MSTPNDYRKEQNYRKLLQSLSKQLEEAREVEDQTTIDSIIKEITLQVEEYNEVYGNTLEPLLLLDYL